MAGTDRLWRAAVDFGGTLTDVVLRPPDGEGREDLLAAFPSLGPVREGALEASLGRALAEGGIEAGSLGLVAVTGGRSSALADRWCGIPVVRVQETCAIARGGLVSGARSPALVASLGTGTALVLAQEPDEPLHLVGSGIGGGTLLGLARLLLGTGDPVEVDRLASTGDPAVCDLLVGDILGGGIGDVPAEATAAHFGRLGREPAIAANRADLAAALVNLVAQAVLRLAFEAALRHHARSILLVGHLLDVRSFRAVVERIPRLAPDFVAVARDPGFAVARGALAEAVRDRCPPRGRS